MNANVNLKDDIITIELSKPLSVVESYSTKIYNVKKIVIETLDVVLDCFDENDKILGSIFYRIDGKQNIHGEMWEEMYNISLIENGTISEDIFIQNAYNENGVAIK